MSFRERFWHLLRIVTWWGKRITTIVRAQFLGRLWEFQLEDSAAVAMNLNGILSDLEYHSESDDEMFEIPLYDMEGVVEDKRQLGDQMCAKETSAAGYKKESGKDKPKVDNGSGGTGDDDSEKTNALRTKGYNKLPAWNLHPRPIGSDASKVNAKKRRVRFAKGTKTHDGPSKPRKGRKSSKTPKCAKKRKRDESSSSDSSGSESPEKSPPKTKNRVAAAAKPAGKNKRKRDESSSSDSSGSESPPKTKNRVATAAKPGGKSDAKPESNRKGKKKSSQDSNTKNSENLKKPTKGGRKRQQNSQRMPRESSSSDSDSHLSFSPKRPKK